MQQKKGSHPLDESPHCVTYFFLLSANLRHVALQPAFIGKYIVSVSPFGTDQLSTLVVTSHILISGRTAIHFFFFLLLKPSISKRK